MKLEDISDEAIVDILIGSVLGAVIGIILALWW